MTEEKPLTLFELLSHGIERYKELKSKKEAAKINKEQNELDVLRKQVQELESEKMMADEKQKLLDKIAILQKEVAEKKIAEVVQR